MKRLALALAFAGAALAATAAPARPAQDDRPTDARNGPRFRTPGDPASVIAAELAFARLAQEKGQWAAFRATAAPEAEMFVPQRVNAQAWLKKRPEPPAAVRWQPHQVWLSCDGATAITRGAWQGGSGQGYFTTVWQRQTKDGSWKWVLDQGDALARPLGAPDMIAGNTAECTPRAGPLPASPPPAGVDAKDGASADRTLQWSTWVWPDGSRLISARIWNGASFDPVFDLRVAKPG